ncbi:beta-N-acetylglucosaminidase [Arenibacter aquaticus]|uniref:beta-N-acetylhexosaminidase n=1 Tax=Arenibacter aquaticus TaxID=2489054 RepID=A0A3S0AML3_9FLAO|nr:beta-N-acetylhexosaminidase [Arenibacter aquaticus]RTE53571.1 beta-N-acetylglucosaminidase [Arenibacter aquaticus]
MRILIFFLIGLLTISCADQNKNTENPEQAYQIIPKPMSLVGSKGSFLVNGNTYISNPEALRTEAEYLSEMLGSAIGTQLPMESSKTGEGGITLKLDGNIENEEGYELVVEYNSITISGKTAKGVFYGIQTLRQLMPPTIESGRRLESELSVPAVVIKDEPRFAYRGMMLDVSRHFFPVSFVKKYIDLIALHKMNTLHWHLTEDQAWRIEIKKYPRLTKVGAYRNGTIIGHHPGTANDQEVYGGFYTQEDVKDIVAYAAKQHVTIIPEIEMPGHGAAAIAAYPYLSCFPEEPTTVFNDMMSNKSRELQKSGIHKIVQETWGVMDDVFCGGKESTFEFLQDVLDEVIPLFPSKYVHIGGDESPKAHWERCPNCQNRIKKENLSDEHELQSYFVQRMEKYINGKGKQIIGWDEILEGGLAPNATVMSWRGEKGGIEAAKQHHDVIMTPTTYNYFDYYQSEDTENEPLAIGGFLPLEKVYSYNPIPKELDADEQKFVLGAQGNVWTEYMKTEDQVEYMTFPRMTALSEVVWSPQESRSWEDFKGRLEHLAKRYDVLDIDYATHFLEKK